MSGMYFAQTKLRMLGKLGKATPDADGYYELVVGGLNVCNNTNSYKYVADGVKELFGPGSLLHRRVANGCLRAEVGHPTKRPGESDNSFVNRMLDIDRNNVCAHFKEIWLDENFGKNHPEYRNPELIAIMAKVKPAEPKGAMLLEGLENPNENVCFSIRAIAEEMFVKGKLIRILKEVITIDFVNEGGITIASKWDSPATESAVNKISGKVTQEMLVSATQKESAFATESSAEAASVIVARHFKPAVPPIWNKW